MEKRKDMEGKYLKARDELHYHKQEWYARARTHTRAYTTPTTHLLSRPGVGTGDGKCRSCDRRMCCRCPS